MALSNPAFNNAAFTNAAVATRAPQPGMTSDQLDELYNRPAASPVDTDRMSYDDVIMKTLGTFGLVLVGATVGFFIPALALPAMLVGFVLGLVNTFKKQPSAALVLAYGAAQGVFLGGISRVLESAFSGIIMQALIGTGAVFAVTLALFANGKVRASARATKIFLIAMVGYLVFSLINVVLQFTGVSPDPWGLNTGVEIFGIPLGLLIGPLVILMAAYSLVLDFTQVQQGVAAGAPRIMGWRAAFGLVLTIVWLYIEMLRFIAIIRGNN